MKPYILWFGRYNKHSVETMMFDPRGYAYLTEFILVKIQDKPQLTRRVADVVARGENPKVKSCCPVCGAPATKILARGNCDEGYTFELEAWCEEHVPRQAGGMIVPLKFSSVNWFRSRWDQKAFMKQLRKHCGITRLTLEKAVEFFFPED